MEGKILHKWTAKVSVNFDETSNIIHMFWDLTGIITINVERKGATWRFFKVSPLCTDLEQHKSE